jgi:hypothetical protein
MLPATAASAKVRKMGERMVKLLCSVKKPIEPAPAQHRKSRTLRAHFIDANSPLTG